MPVWLSGYPMGSWVSTVVARYSFTRRGFCTFKPTAPEWLDVVASARQAVLNKSIPSHFTQLAIHSELVDLLTLCMGGGRILLNV